MQQNRDMHCQGTIVNTNTWDNLYMKTNQIVRILLLMIVFSSYSVLLNKSDPILSIWHCSRECNFFGRPKNHFCSCMMHPRAALVRFGMRPATNITTGSEVFSFPRLQYRIVGCCFGDESPKWRTTT
jgi:hypothetical protein